MEEAKAVQSETVEVDEGAKKIKRKGREG